MPTFPPTFVTPLSLFNITTNSSLYVIPSTTSTTKIASDHLRRANTFFKSNTYPSTNFICSKCCQTIEYCDVGVQTEIDNHTTTFSVRSASPTAFDNKINNLTTWILFEPYHTQRINQEYQIGNTRKIHYDTRLPPGLIPQMHRI